MNELLKAVAEFQAAHAAMPRNQEAGWVDDFQRRDRRCAQAAATLLDVALAVPSNALPPQEAPT